MLLYDVRIDPEKHSESMQLQDFDASEGPAGTQVVWEGVPGVVARGDRGHQSGPPRGRPGREGGDCARVAPQLLHPAPPDCKHLCPGMTTSTKQQETLCPRAPASWSAVCYKVLPDLQRKGPAACELPCMTSSGAQNAMDTLVLQTYRHQLTTAILMYWQCNVVTNTAAANL